MIWRYLPICPLTWRLGWITYDLKEQRFVDLYL